MRGKWRGDNQKYIERRVDVGRRGERKGKDGSGK